MRLGDYKKIFNLRVFAVSLVVSMLLSSLFFTNPTFADNPHVSPSPSASPTDSPIPNGNTGSIWTTNFNCQKVNANHFNVKQDVYLNGGPNGNGNGNSGLPNGSYFVKVTEPGGSLLGQGGPVIVTDGSFASCLSLWDLTHFSDTTNPGHEYKVWVSQNNNFPDSGSKTDNFQVDAVVPSPSTDPSTPPSPSSDPTTPPSSSPTPTSPTCGQDEHLNLQGDKCLKWELGGPPQGGGSSNSGGQVLGTSTVKDPGQVLGAHTLGATGSSYDYVGLSLIAAGTAIAVISGYEIKKTL